MKWNSEFTFRFIKMSLVANLIIIVRFFLEAYLLIKKKFSIQLITSIPRKLLKIIVIANATDFVIKKIIFSHWLFPFHCILFISYKIISWDEIGINLSAFCQIFSYSFATSEQSDLKENQKIPKLHSTWKLRVILVFF